MIRKTLCLSGMWLIAAFAARIPEKTGQAPPPWSLLTARVEGEVYYQIPEKIQWEAVPSAGPLEAAMVQTGEGAFFQGRLREGSELRIGPESRVGIATASRGGESAQEVRLLRGAMYWKRSGSEAGNSHYLGSVCLPVGCIDTRDGSAILEVNPEIGRTDLFALQGRLKVLFAAGDNGGKPFETLFVESGEILTLWENGVREEISAFSRPHLSALYPWMEPKVLDYELGMGQLRKRRERELLRGAPLQKVLLLDFSYAGVPVEGWDVSRFLSDFLEDYLNRQEHLQVVRLHPRGNSPLELGHKARAHRVIYGTINRFKVENSAAYKEEGKRYVPAQRAEVSLFLQIWDPREEKLLYQGEVDLDTYQTGESSLESLLKGPLEAGRAEVRNSTVWDVAQSLAFKLSRMISVP